ncbi:UbiX family flavin prenyltransferase [Nannocystis bainbridge]|uniref:Flavin prenyltransferase UbiX n=1 Tax=Nannocystis bainbridge TaxID=2995303 RepID=A0ABT5E352_9BACT|nr:UbiX family flavin prenyltransferase [Nannocystis bainbridge]MDC0719739.1 UbiX family flavin prenyltransferase [Nannocystis bainbridge]
MKLVVIVTGASGAIYARRALHVLADLCAGTGSNEPAYPGLEVDWVASATAPQVWLTELGEPMPLEISAHVPTVTAGEPDEPDEPEVPPALPSATAARREPGTSRAGPPTEFFGSNVFGRMSQAVTPSATPTLKGSAREPGPASESAPSRVRRWDRQDFSAPFASGSNAPDAVLVMPCSMSALSRVAHGGGDDLAARACEVALKERRRLVLVVRETPLSLVHLRNMVAATEAGAIILPAVPSFYGAVRTLEDAVDTVVARALDHVGLRVPLTRRWGDPESA